MHQIAAVRHEEINEERDPLPEIRLQFNEITEDEISLEKIRKKQRERTHNQKSIDRIQDDASKDDQLFPNDEITEKNSQLESAEQVDFNIAQEPLPVAEVHQRYADYVQPNQNRRGVGRGCPKCGDPSLHRSHTTKISERLKKFLSGRLPYRCHKCQWRGWLTKN